MWRNNKMLLAIGLLVLASVALAACQPAAEVSDEAQEEALALIDALQSELEEATGDSERVAELEAALEDARAEVEAGMQEAGGECCDVYRIGIFEDPRSLNYWSYLGPDSSVWTGYVVNDTAPSLFTLSDQRFDFVPSMAADLVSPVQEGEVWTMTVEMVDDAVWSDGTPITANDVVFTHAACIDLELTSNWPNQCMPDSQVGTPEAIDDYTVKFSFNEAPGLGVWNAGVALAPILPEHFWGGTVAEARSFIEGVTAPEADCSAEELSDADAAACTAYSEAFENARKTLYGASGVGAPTGGGYSNETLEAGAFVQRDANPKFYFKDARVLEYDDGTWVLEQPNGRRVVLYGDESGEKILDIVSGPYADNIILSIYGSQDAAFLALADGEIDYVLNPLGLSRGLKEQAIAGEGIQSISNADYGLFYVAFNMRKEPYSFPEFRQAFDALIDKEFVVDKVLGGVVFPMYSVMPPGNAFWFTDVENPYIGLSRDERVNEAVSVLKDAGWTWTQEPAWSDDIQDVVPGEGLRMPNGQPMPETTILGPGPAYDPIRATFNQWISEWGREMGMPISSELTGFNTILDPVFVDADFDMYILGWGLGNRAFPDYFDSFWHSKNDTAVSGNFNTPGYSNPDYDAMADEFMGTTDLGRAQELVFEMQHMIANDRPYIPLFYKQIEDLIRTNIVLPYSETLGGITQALGFQTDAQPLFK